MESHFAMIIEIEGRQVEVDSSFGSLDPAQQQAQVDEIAKSFAPAPTAESTANAAVDTEHSQGAGGANSVVAPVVTGLAAGPLGFGKVANNIPGMVKDPATGKWMALENYGRQMHGGNWYGGKHMADVYERGVKAATDPALAAQYKAEALQNMTKGQKVAAKLPGPVKGALTAPLGMLGRTIGGVAVGAQGADAYNRYNSGDTTGAIISGLGAIGSGAAMVPHPIARGVGTAVSLGAEGLNSYLDHLKAKKAAAQQPQAQAQPQMAKGGLVDKKDGLSKAEEAALKILEAKKAKKRHLR